ncbi:MAG: RNA polymerase sigma factor [Acidobacteriota bacterium]
MESEGARFTELFHRTYPALCRFLCGLLQDAGAAQDLAQETFLRLHRTGLDCLEPGQERFWVFRVARNLALNEVEKARNRSRLLDLLPWLQNRGNPTPEDEMRGRQSRAILSRLMEQLPADQQTALLLREQAELSYREIARVMDVSESKVKVDIFRARNTLRQRWGAVQQTSSSIRTAKARSG